MNKNDKMNISDKMKINETNVKNWVYSFGGCGTNYLRRVTRCFDAKDISFIKKDKIYKYVHQRMPNNILNH